MSRSEHDERTNGVTLLPHQSQFVETVFSNSSKRIVLLRAPVGMGKSAALAGVALHLLRNRPTARSLVSFHVRFNLNLQIGSSVTRFRRASSIAMFFVSFSMYLATARSGPQVPFRSSVLILRSRKMSATAWPNATGTCYC